jgi:signal transduction histidine kinase
MKVKRLSTALRLALIYGVITGLWILLADNVLMLLLPEAAQTRPARWGFVLMASLMLYFLVGYALRARERAALRFANVRDDSERAALDTALRAIVEGTASATGEDFFRSLVRHLASALQVRYAFVAECADAARTRVRTLAFWMGRDFGQNFEYALADTPCAHVIGGEKCYHPQQLRQRFPKDRDLFSLGADSYLGVPITDSAGDVIGHLVVMHDQPMPDEARGLAILKIFAERAGAEMERERAQRQLQRRLRESQALADINQALNETLDLERIFQMIADSARAIIPNVERAVIHALVERQNVLQPVAVSGLRDEPGQTSLTMRPGEGLAGWVMAEGQVVNAGDTRAEPRYLPPGSGTPMRSLLVVPVQSGPHRLGTLSVMSAAPQAFSADDERLLKVLGTQAGLAVAKAWLLKSERAQRQWADALRGVGAVLSATLDFDEVLDRLLDQTAHVASYDSAAILLADADTGAARAARRRGCGCALPETTRPMEDTPLVIARTENLRWMAETKRPLVIADVSTYPGWANFRVAARPPRPSGAWVGAPVVVDGEVLAFFSLESATPGFYRPEHADRLEAFAVQAALALQNARLFQAARRQLEELKVLNAVAIAGTEAANEDALIERAMAVIDETLYPDLFGVMLLDEAAGVLRIHPSYRFPESVSADPIPLGRGVTGRVALDGRPRLIADVSQHPEYFSAYGRTRSELCVPLKTGERILGVINAESTRLAAFSETDLRLLTTLAGQLATAIEKARLYADLERALHQEKTARAQLVQSEKLAALGRIMASVAHELNNPLQTIQNALYLIQQTKCPEAQAHENVQVAMEESDRMADLISRLRDTYRPATREEFRPESLNDLVADVHKLLASHLRRREIVFEFDPDPNLPPVPGLRSQLKQAVLNLSLNAVDAMTPGGRLTLRTRYLPETSEARLTVTDTGVGIDPAALPDIFDPFFTTKENGTGLGLAITHDIIRQHGGRIEAESQVGQGTTFRLWLPTVIATIKPHSVSGGRRLNGPRIGNGDDEP